METNQISPVELVLTCGSWQEAQRIVDSLLQQKLIACAEFMEVKSKYHWKGKIEDDKEIRLVMQSAAHLFENIEAEVKKLHSYEAFVLHALPVSHLSQETVDWLRNCMA